MPKNPIKIRILLAAALFPAVSSLIAQTPAAGGQQAAPQAPASQQSAASPEEIIETFGFLMGMNSRLRDLELTDKEFDLFLKGVKRARAGEDVPEDIASIIPQLQQYLGERQMRVTQAQGKVNREKADQFFAELEKREGVKKTPEGVFVEIEKQGEGETPEANSVVRIHYEGRLIDGTVFDASKRHGEGPAEFPLTGVVPGMRAGVSQLQEGGKATLYIPPDLGYGDQSQGQIPPGSALIFEVELVEVLEPPQGQPGQALPGFPPPQR